MLYNGFFSVIDRYMLLKKSIIRHVLYHKGTFYPLCNKYAQKPHRFLLKLAKIYCFFVCFKHFQHVNQIG